MAPHQQETEPVKAENVQKAAKAAKAAAMGGSKTTAISFPQPPVFTDKVKEREYLLGRLAAAFRIFGKLGYDEGVAGHITVRVCTPNEIQTKVLHQLTRRMILWSQIHSGLTLSG